MKYLANYVESIGETRIELQSNCYSDTAPFLRRIQLRKVAVDLTGPTTAVAAAILTAGNCGEVFDFPGAKIGSDHADALRMILGEQTNILGVDGMIRALSSGELDIAVGKAPNAPRPEPADVIPLRTVDWNGDFVTRETRSSKGFVFGAVQTNAAFFASDARVSIALGLIAARDRCRNLYIEAKPNDEVDTIARALQIIGVSLILLPDAATAPRRR